MTEALLTLALVFFVWRYVVHVRLLLSVRKHLDGEFCREPVRHKSYWVPTIGKKCPQCAYSKAHTLREVRAATRIWDKVKRD